MVTFSAMRSSIQVANSIKNQIGTRGIAGRISGGGFLIVLENTRNEEDLRGILRAIRTNTEFAFQRQI